MVRRGAGDGEIAVVAKAIVPFVAAVAIWGAIAGGDTIVALLLMGYALVTQLLPALVASLAGRRLLTAWGAGAGIVVGVALVAFATIAKASLASLAPTLPGWIADLNIGIVALALNVATAALVSLGERAVSRAGTTAASSI